MMSDFDYDVYCKKRIASQAKYRKNGSKSRKCSMSTDYMTRRQWEKRNGEVFTMNLNCPMNWSEFKALTKTMQEEYISHLVSRFNVNATSLAQLFRVSSVTVRNYLKERGLEFDFRVGRRMTEAQRDEFTGFIIGEDSESDHASACEQDPPEEEEPVQIDTRSAIDAMALRKFSLSFSGKLDPHAIVNSLTQILGTEAVGDIEIVCDLQNEKGHSNGN